MKKSLYRRTVLGEDMFVRLVRVLHSSLHLRVSDNRHYLSNPNLLYARYSHQSEMEAIMSRSGRQAPRNIIAERTTTSTGYERYTVLVADTSRKTQTSDGRSIIIMRSMCATQKSFLRPAARRWFVRYVKFTTGARSHSKWVGPITDCFVYIVRIS